MQLLKNKNILVGVTGSIAIYKTLELIRLYIKAGANVKVIMTNGAKKFINPITFETISQNRVLDDSNEDWSNQTNHNHIACGKWADLFVLAPVSANTINKLSNGIADNILTQTALAYSGIKLLSPAANTNMIHNPLTQASLKMLKLCNYKIISTQTKELACKDVGDGAMADPSDIFHQSCQELLKDEYWSDRKVVLNGGGTIEKIDDVRYISNFSSGKMAAALATALYYKGADVCLITTKDVQVPSGVYTLDVQNTQEMLELVEQSIRVAKKGKLSHATLMDKSNVQLIQKKPYFFAVAAVSDYIVKFPQNGKLKKQDIGQEWNLQLVQNIDLLASLQKDGIYTIGFKAELNKDQGLQNAQAMLENKNLDAVCLNYIDQTNQFGSDSNSIELIGKSNSVQKLSGAKLDVSFELLQLLKEQFAN